MARHVIQLGRGEGMAGRRIDAPALAARDWSRDLVTREGLAVHVRPARPGDEAALADFFLQVTPEDLYHRFLTGLNRVDQGRIAAMTRNDDPDVVDFVAIEEPGGTIVATAMLTLAPDGETAEFALCTRGDKKHRGLSWTMLDHLVAFGRALGLGEIQSIQSWDDRAAIDLEREMGFAIRRYPGDATLLIAEKTLEPAHA